MTQRPVFHEHEQDSLIPPGYGIDESHDGGFYPYRLEPLYQGQHPHEQGIVYLKWHHNGLDVRLDSYGQALEYIAEVTE